MGRAPCCSKVGLHRGAWSTEEDKLLTEYIQTNGEGLWRSMPSKAGLLRCGKSCRLRWVNYLRPGIKRGNFTADENDIIIRLHSIHGPRWSLIATKLAGRTDNEVKNHWNAHLKRILVLESGKTHVDDSTNKKKRKKNKKMDQKSRKVKILEKPEENVPHPASSSSLTLGKEDSYNNGVMNSESPSSITFQDADLLAMGTDFSWTDCETWFQMEGGARMDDDDDSYIRFNGFDELMFEEEEIDMLEKLYDECRHLLENEEEV